MFTPVYYNIFCYSQCVYTDGLLGLPAFTCWTAAAATAAAAVFQLPVYSWSHSFRLKRYRIPISLPKNL